MYAVIGLGNPTPKYDGTRHNLGAEVVEQLCARLHIPNWRTSMRPKMLVARGVLGEHEVTLALPQTMMNRSGAAARELVDDGDGGSEHESGGTGAEHLIVVYDDLDLPLGSLKISFGRSSGGHNGVESIISALNSKDFVRVRLGISPVSEDGVVRTPYGEKKVHDFILGTFSAAEQRVLSETIPCAVEAIAAIITDGHVKAMERFNNSPYAKMSRCAPPWTHGPR